MKKSGWILLGIVILLGLLAILYNNQREHYTAFPTMTCTNPAAPSTPLVTGTAFNTEILGIIMSIAGGAQIGATDSNSTIAVTYMIWLEQNFPAAATDAVGLANFILTYGAYSGISTPTKQGQLPPPPQLPAGATSWPANQDWGEFAKNYAKALNAFDPILKGPNPAVTPEGILVDLNTTNAHAANVVYTWFYGGCAAANTMSGGAAPPSSTLSPLTPSSSSSGSAASNASSVPSSSTTVPVPSPCHAGLQSIPGGSMEFKCFNS